MAHSVQRQYVFIINIIIRDIQVGFSISDTEIRGDEPNICSFSKETLSENLTGSLPISDRVTIITLKTVQSKINIIQVYASEGGVKEILLETLD